MAGATKKNKKGKPEEDLDEVEVGGEEELEDEESEELEDGGKGEDAVEEESHEEETKPDKTGDVVLVNQEKVGRAKDIYVLVAGKRAPRDANEQDRKEHYIQQLSVRGVKPNDKEEKVVRALYEVLGGLVRNPAEQREAEKKAAAQKEKLKKQKIAK